MPTRTQFNQGLTDFADRFSTYVGKLTGPHPFIERLLKHIEWTPADLRKFVLDGNQRFVQTSGDEALGPQSPADSRIEKLCHKIWLTSDKDPHSPPADLFGQYLEMCRGLSVEWTHLFWTNSEFVSQWVTERARRANAKVLAVNIDGIALGPIESTLRKLIADRKYVLAADALKFVILNRFGGLYSDLGVFFEQSILDIVSAADYTFLFASNMFFQTSWVSLAKESFLSNVFLAILNNPETLSAAYAIDESTTVHAGTEVHTFAGLGYTTCALLLLPPTATRFAFPENLPELKWRGQSSWYGDTPKFGNALINKTGPSLFRLQNYAMYNERAAARLYHVNVSARVVEAATLAVKLFEYFQAHPRKLSQIFLFNETDQVGEWHNYGYLYDLLLCAFNPAIHALLIVADRASLWGRAASDGPSRGGMARAWRSYRGAHVDGVEIERSRDFVLSLTDPLPVNEAGKSSLRDLLAPNTYDIIVDNGIHSFDVAVMLLEAASKALIADGIHFIEAVSVGDLDRWRAYLAQANRSGLIFVLPHESNVYDNCMIAVFR